MTHGTSNLYVLAGGGTAGHVYPALAIGEAIAKREPDSRFAYIGVKQGAEAEILPRHEALVPPGRVYFVSASGLSGGLGAIRFGITLLRGARRARSVLKSLGPAAVVGTGGYAAAPALFAARSLGVPAVLNEQNAQPGRANRLCGKWADAVTVSYAETARYFGGKTRVTGYPVRAAIREAAAQPSGPARSSLCRDLGIGANRKIVLVTGGSLGARSINRCMVEVAARVAADQTKRGQWFFVHGVGRNESPGYHAWRDTTSALSLAGLDAEGVTDFYRPERFLFDIERYYAAADIVVCRAGAGSLTEAAAFAKPTLVVPKSGLPGDHQSKNAQLLLERGACRVLSENADGTADPGAFLAEIERLGFMASEEKRNMAAAFRETYREDALDRIVDTVFAVSRR